MSLCFAILALGLVVLAGMSDVSFSVVCIIQLQKKAEHEYMHLIKSFKALFHASSRSLSLWSAVL